MVERFFWSRSVSAPDRSGGGGLHICAERMAVLESLYGSELKLASTTVFDRSRFRGLTLFKTESKNTSFQACLFLDGVFLSEAEFSSLSMKDAILAKGFYCLQAKFNYASNFVGARFDGPVSFSESEFRREVTFNNAYFKERADFSGCHFGALARFDQATFSGEATFVGAPASDETSSTVQAVSIEKTTTQSQVGGTIDMLVGNVTAPPADGPLKRRAFRNLSFTEATFHRTADFSNPTFLAATDFSQVRFAQLAKFHDFRLHQDTSFAGASFAMPKAPDVPRDAEKPDGEQRPPSLHECNRHFEEYERAFRSLKLAMEGLRARREEARFYRKELEARRKRPSIPPAGGGAKEVTFAEKGISYLYQWVSGFGESLLTPVLWLIGLWVAFGILLRASDRRVSFQMLAVGRRM